jgi:hypothetical protein
MKHFLHLCFFIILVDLANISALIFVTFIIISRVNFILFNQIFISQNPKSRKIKLNFRILSSRATTNLFFQTERVHAS